MELISHESCVKCFSQRPCSELPPTPLLVLIQYLFFADTAYDAAIRTCARAVRCRPGDNAVDLNKEFPHGNSEESNSALRFGTSDCLRESAAGRWGTGAPAIGL